MHIESATRDDFPSWLSMRYALYTGLDESFHRREMETIIAANDMAAFLARLESGEVVGLLELSLRNIVDGCLGGSVAYIEGVYLKPEYRGLRHGASLVDFAEKWAVSHGCTNLATDTEIENLSAQEFLRHAGFDETWRIVQFKKSIER